MPFQPRDFRPAPKGRQATRDQRGFDQHRRHRHAGKARGIWILPHRAHLKAQGCAGLDDPNHHRRNQRQRKAPVQAQTRNQPGQPRLRYQRRRFWPAHACGVLHRTFQQIADDQQHDKIEQKRGHHLVHAKFGFQQHWTQQQDRPRQHRHSRRDRQHKRRTNRPRSQQYRHHSTRIKLRFGSDVP